MKTKRFILALALLAVLLMGCGCAARSQPQDTRAEDYAARISALEETLQQEREARFISDSAYEQRIRELEQQLSALSSGASGEASDLLDETAIFHYRLEGDAAVITGYEGGSTLVNVPGVLDGHPVVGIGDRAFEGKQIAAVILPGGLERIGWFAFYGCEKLIDVSIPESVSAIGYAVFDGCPGLTIVCSAESYAARYAQSYGIPYITP